MKIVFMLILALAMLLKAMPNSPPDTSKTSAHVNGTYGIVVSVEKNTYLEVESGYLDGSEHYSVHLYYTKVGGWFQRTERILILSAKNTSDSDKVQFKKVNSNPLAPISIYIDSDPSKKRFYVFTPPLKFKQAYSIKPIIIQ